MWFVLNLICARTPSFPLLVCSGWLVCYLKGEKISKRQIYFTLFFSQFWNFLIWNISINSFILYCFLFSFLLVKNLMSSYFLCLNFFWILIYLFKLWTSVSVKVLNFGSVIVAFLNLKKKSAWMLDKSPDT